MNLSTWESNSKIRNNPSLSSGHVIIEFDRTKQSKILAHKLAQISFDSQEINPLRDEIITNTVFTTKYNSIRYTYIPPVLIQPGANGRFIVLSHGHPITAGVNEGYENCFKSGLQCLDGEGEDKLCSPGKCVIGKFFQVDNSSKWRYESANTYDSSSVIYYVGGKEEVTLKTITRGVFTTYTENGTASVKIDKPASIYTRILLPPKGYYSDHFLDSPRVLTDERLKVVFRRPVNEIIGIEDRKARFMVEIVKSASENNPLSSVEKESLREELSLFFNDLHVEWRSRVEEIISLQFNLASSNFEFVSSVYDQIKSLFNSIIQSSPSSLKRGGIDYDRENIARPVYSRLPGIMEGYRSDPLFSESESPAQWLTSGVDDFLSKKKDQLASFYANYLDPQTCSPLTLDWLAQHVGLFGKLWDTRWDRKIKIAMIENAFGWFDREKVVSVPGLGDVSTPKGKVLHKFPFSSSNLWTSDPEEDNLLTICTNEVGGFELDVNTLSINSGFSYKKKVFDSAQYSLALQQTDSIKIYNGRWNGLMESKGSFLSFAFLSSVFNLKAHSYKELEVTGFVNGSPILKPRSGLREAEISAPTLLPYKPEVINVGNESIVDVGVVSGSDLKLNNYSNQLVADISKVSEIENSRNLFIRVPYYYNRNGKSWSRAKYIVDNWLPDNLNKRVQYAYLSADLWAVGDAYFEPEISQI